MLVWDYRSLHLTCRSEGFFSWLHTTLLTLCYFTESHFQLEHTTAVVYTRNEILLYNSRRRCVDQLI